MTKDEIIAELEKRGIEHNKSDLKDDLAALLDSGIAKRPGYRQGDVKPVKK